MSISNFLFSRFFVTHWSTLQFISARTFIMQKRLCTAVNFARERWSSFKCSIPSNQVELTLCRRFCRVILHGLPIESLKKLRIAMLSSRFPRHPVRVLFRNKGLYMSSSSPFVPNFIALREVLRKKFARTQNAEYRSTNCSHSLFLLSPPPPSFSFSFSWASNRPNTLPGTLHESNLESLAVNGCWQTLSGYNSHGHSAQYISQFEVMLGTGGLWFSLRCVLPHLSFTTALSFTSILDAAVTEKCASCTTRSPFARTQKNVL